MKKIEIEVKDSVMVELLESLSLEVFSRKDVISFILSSDVLVPDSKSFKQYHDEYQKFYKQYDVAKQEFQKLYVDVIPNAVDWNLDFNDSLLTVTVDEKEN